MQTKLKLIKPGFRAALQADGTLELLVYEEIGETPWYGGGITAKTVKDQIDAAGAFSKIVMRINSPGGDVFEGIAIYNLVRSTKKPVEVRVDGIAASSASIIAMAGDEIIMGLNAMMMIHNAYSICIGYAVDMREMALKLDKISGVIASSYRDKTRKSIEEILALMDAETWMTAQECVDGGFATKVDSEPDNELEARALAIAKRFRAMSRFERVPDRFRDAAAEPVECACDCQNCADGDCASCTNVECDDPNCTDCPMQDGNAGASAASVETFESRLALLDRQLQ